jgi:exoribonuclease-2
MVDHGLEPDFPSAAQRQADTMSGPARAADAVVRDLRDRPWCSIDDEDSRDLDQLTVTEAVDAEAVRVMVAIADVTAAVAKGSPIDEHAAFNTTSVYTPARIFAMLPERLSTDLTSLAAGEDRLAVVVSFVVQADGGVVEPELFRANVHNKAKLAYESVAGWLEGQGPEPREPPRVPGLDEQLRVQDRVAGALRSRRQERGALDLETIEPRAIVEDDRVVDVRERPANRARRLIEDFMITANGVTVRFLESKGFPTVRRVIASPERWDRLEALAAAHGDHLPDSPDPRALSDFLVRRRTADRLHFPDLSLAVVKLLGRGEYALERPGARGVGHFGLAVRDYAHSTAPNRRYPDVITQRLVKAALAGETPPYTDDELRALAAHCTTQEDAANKVERQVRKSAAALFISSRVGQRFDALVTGTSPKGTWVRTLRPPVEGRLVRGEAGRQVGDRLAVRLVSTDVERGHIDFEAD